jgi:hypothetical protein
VGEWGPDATVSKAKSSHDQHHQDEARFSLVRELLLGG